MAHKNQPWFAEKRAHAFAYSLLAERDLIVREQPTQGGNSEWLVNLTKHGKETGRSFALIIQPFLDFPEPTRMSDTIAKQLPEIPDSETLLPLVVFAVQVRHLDAGMLGFASRAQPAKARPWPHPRNWRGTSWTTRQLAES